jgi:hypothetical protein
VALDDEIARVFHLLDDIDQIARLAFTTYRGYPAEVLVEHSPRAAATNVYDHMVAEAERRWIDRRSIVPRNVRGLKVWIIGPDAVLRFKKMDEDGRSRQYPTKQARDFDRGLPLPGLPEPAIRMTAGYLLDPTQTQFIRAQVSKPRGPAIEWCVAIVPPTEPGRPATWQDLTREGWL